MEVFEQSISELQRRIRSGEVSSTEIVQAHLARVDAVDPEVQAFAHVAVEHALKDAAALDQELTSTGRARGPLHGVPVGVKDIIDVEGCPTACHSRHRAGIYPATDATSVRRLRDAGAVIIGKLQTHEFASGLTTPPTRNPWNLEFIPGGSSGGSAAAVSAGECTAAIGTDTGGSIRIPAALCGVVGFKPSFGMVPRGGVASVAWSFDHLGPLTRSVEDAALVAQAMAGFDSSDPGSAAGPNWSLCDHLHEGARGTVVGVARNLFPDRNRQEIDAVVAQSASHLEQAGAEIVEVELPDADRIYPSTFLAIELTEAAAYHSERLRTAPDLFGADVRRMYEAGRRIPGTTYVNALRMRRQIQLSWQTALEGIDILLAPTVPAEAVPIGVTEVPWPDGKVESIFDLYVRTSAPASLLGLPAISLPAGFMPNGMPFGVQLMAEPFADADLLRVSAALETALAFPGGVPGTIPVRVHGSRHQ